MKRIFLITLIFGAIILAQTTSPYLLPIWNGSRYIWAKLGPTLVLNGNQLDALLPPPSVRRTDVLLVYDVTAKGWKLPVVAHDVAVYVNGLRYRQSSDYIITNGVILAQYENMTATHVVTADFSE